MTEDIENESIRISELPETTQVDKSNDCLVISKTSDIYSTGSKSYKITPQNLLDGVGVDYTAGDNITISDDNVISATIPTASSSDLGGVKVGSGLTINSEGVLSATGGGGGASSFSDLDDVSINEHTLVNGQVPVYNSATQKWENMNQSGGSGGHTILDDEGTSLTQRDDLQFKGAYSEDDSTDEKTVVNVVREMTKAEFDELTETEKTGLINITDITGGNDDRFQPVIYSEEEREIGVWTDGKPLYQKTVSLTNITIAVSGGYSYDISSWNVDTIVKNPEGFITLSNDTDLRTVPFGILGSYATAVTATKSAINFSRIGGDLTCNRVVFTLVYTKSTDQAGSGQWTPQGVPTHHYSEDEQVIGTWIDGSTLYEKTINFGELPNTTTKTVNHNISNIETIYGIEGVAYSSSTNTTINLPYPNTDNTNVVTLSANRTIITIITYRDRTSFNGYVTLRYTKTT